jgi:uncharacterized membrane protein
MKAKVNVAGHALHPMLVVFPLGLLATSVVWDICYLVAKDATWGVVSFWTIVAGVIGGLLAAIPGFIDWLSIPKNTRARTVGAYHMALNLVVVGMFVITLVARWSAPEGYALVGVGRMVFGWIGLAVALVSSWLGGELIETLGVAVRDDANLNAPSPLGRREGGGTPPRRSTSQYPIRHEA